MGPGDRSSHMAKLRSSDAEVGASLLEAARDDRLFTSLRCVTDPEDSVNHLALLILWIDAARGSDLATARSEGPSPEKLPLLIFPPACPGTDFPLESRWTARSVRQRTQVDEQFRRSAGRQAIACAIIFASAQMDRDLQNLSVNQSVRRGAATECYCVVYVRRRTYGRI